MSWGIFTASGREFGVRFVSEAGAFERIALLGRAGKGLTVRQVT